MSAKRRKDDLIFSGIRRSLMKMKKGPVLKPILGGHALISFSLNEIYGFFTRPVNLATVHKLGFYDLTEAVVSVPQ